MKKFSVSILLLILSAFICIGTGTSLGASGSIVHSAPQVNMINLTPDAVHSAPPINMTNLTADAVRSAKSATPIPIAPNIGSNDLKSTKAVRSSLSSLINSPYLQVNLTNQNPYPARSGEIVELTVSAQNVGHKDMKDITVTVSPKYPFSQFSGEALQKSVSYLNARQTDNDASVLKFKLMIDSNASEGTCDIDIITTAKESGSSSSTIATTKTIRVEVRGKEYAQIVTINKADIDVGKEESLEFIITNKGNSPLKNMVVSWKDPKGIILPIYSDNTKYIKYLEPGKSVKVDYSVMADVSAIPGLYTLNINLAFEDYESKSKSIQTTAGLFVGGITDFDVSYSESSQGKISLAVANVGNNKAYAVKFSIPEQEGYKVSGSSSNIVGNLEKGDYTIASFNITSTKTVGKDSVTAPDTSQANYAVVNNTISDSISSRLLKVQIGYTDAKGERITVNKEVAVPASGFSTRNLAAAQGNKINSYNSSLLYIAIIVIAGAGVFVYRRRKQGAKKD